MQYKLLVLDIDGTIVKAHSNTVSQPVMHALKKANEYVEIVVMSARASKDQELVTHILDLKPFYQIVENGSSIINTYGFVEQTITLAKSEITEILALETILDESAANIQGSWIPIAHIPDDAQISTLSLISRNDLSSELEAYAHLFSITTGSHWINPEWHVSLVSNINASKGQGVAYIQKETGIQQAETIVVGDGASDISAMNHAGLKVAMGNAEEAVKLIADHIAQPVEEDGIVGVIDTYIIPR